MPASRGAGSRYVFIGVFLLPRDRRQSRSQPRSQIVPQPVAMPIEIPATSETAKGSRSVVIFSSVTEGSHVLLVAGGYSKVPASRRVLEGRDAARACAARP